MKAKTSKILKATETYDLRESIIPFSLLQISNRFKTMQPGEFIEILCYDKAVMEDLERILPELEHETRLARLPGLHRPDFCILVRKIK